MLATLRRAVAAMVRAIKEMNEAQRRLFVLQMAVDRYHPKSNAVPDTYEEFLVRTSGVLLHEPSARRRERRSHR